MDFLGWYTTGDAMSESDIKVHKQVMHRLTRILQMALEPMFLKHAEVAAWLEETSSMKLNILMTQTNYF